MREVLLDDQEGRLEILSRALAECVEVDPLDALGEVLELAGGDAEARASSAGVVEVGLYGGVLGVDTQTEGDAPVGRHLRT